MRIFIIAAYLVLLSGCMTHASEPLVLIYEFRTPKDQKNDPLTKFDFFTDQSATGTRLRFTRQRVEDSQIIFLGDFLIFPIEKRRAMIVSWDDENSISYIFQVPSIQPFTATEWSEWKKPDNLSDSGAGWAFMHKQKLGTPPHGSSKSFEFRYRISQR